MDQEGLFELEEPRDTAATSPDVPKLAPVPRSRRARNSEPASLLPDLPSDITTQGIKYAGSKLKLLPQIVGLIRDLPVHTILDGFSGTTRVSQALAKSGYSVICNDRAEWSYCFGSAYLLNTEPPESYQPLMDHLNNLKPVSGWFTETYGGLDYSGSAVQPDGSKRLWQVHNTKKLDAIRNEIDTLGLDSVTKNVALCALILGLDRVDSTMGHFVSYLREWSARSYANLHLEVPSLLVNKKQHIVTQADIFDSVSANSSSADLTYLDPPYGSNNEKMPPSRVRYQSYYHIWKTMILNDTPDVFGSAKRRADTSDIIASSVFEDFRRSSSGKFIAIDAIEQLIEKTESPYVALSYSSGGRATANELDEALRSQGELIQVLEIEYRKNVMSGMRWTNEWLRDAETKNIEYIFLLRKS